MAKLRHVKCMVKEKINDKICKADDHKILKILIEPYEQYIIPWKQIMLRSSSGL